MKVKEESEKVGLKLNTHKTKIMESGPITSWEVVENNRWGNSGNSVRLYFSGLQNHCRWWLQEEIKRRLLFGRKVMTNLDSILKSRDITFPTKVRLVKAMVFPMAMYVCESWAVKKERLWMPKNRCFWTVVLEKTFESPLDCKETQPVNPKENQSWIFIGEWIGWNWSSNTLAIWCKERTH